MAKEALNQPRSKGGLKSLLEEARRRRCPVWISSTAPWNSKARLWTAQIKSDPTIQEFQKRFVFWEFDSAALPEIDQGLQFILQKLASTSGWPSQIFLDPEGHPIVGVSPLELSDFKKLLFDILSAWDIDPKALSTLSETAQREAVKADPLACVPMDISKLSNEQSSAAEMAFLTPLEQSLDFDTGFVGRSPEVYHFPSVYKALLAREESARWAELALTQLAKSHLCDVIEGGFYRSAGRDPESPVQAEKLLSENAELLDALISAPESPRTEFLLKTASECVQLILSAFESPSSVGFGSSLGGDESYYRLVPSDLLTALSGPQRQPAQMFFGIESGGRVPYLPTELPLLSSFLGIAPVDLGHLLVSAREALAKYRHDRAASGKTRQPVLGVRERYSEALAVRALFRAGTLKSLVSDQDVERHLYPILEDWKKSSVELSKRELWATAGAWVAAAQFGLKRGGSHRMRGMDALNEADNLLSSLEAPSTVLVDLPFLSLRWDVSDHLGPSSVALRLRAMVERIELAFQEGDRARVSQMTQRIETDLSLFLPLCRPLGLHAAGVFEALTRYNYMKING